MSTSNRSAKRSPSQTPVQPRKWPHRSLKTRFTSSTEGEFRNEIEHGSLYLGSPETVAKKLAATISALGIQRFDLKYSAGTLPHEKSMHSIELYGSKVIPMVRDILAG